MIELRNTLYHLTCIYIGYPDKKSCRFENDLLRKVYSFSKIERIDSENFHSMYEVKGMTTVSVCLGSACHLKGANGVLDAFLALIDRYQAQATVQMAGNFCQGRCTEGVVVQIDDLILTHVTKDQVHELFMKYVLNGENK